MNWGMAMADNETELDLLFAQARNDRASIPDALIVRMQTDAEAVRLARLAPSSAKCPRGLLRRLADGLGGWQGMGGLLAASVTGVWIGFAAPAFLPDPANYLMTQDTTYLVADLGLSFDYLEETE